MPDSPVVILTQEDADNTRLAGLLERRGIRSLSYPCISTSYLPFDPEEGTDGVPIEDFTVVAFTSRRGVIGFESAKPILERSGQLIACIGESTAAEFESRFGRRPQIIPEGNQTSTGLADVIVSSIDAPGSVLHVRGSKTTGEFAQHMESQNWSVAELVVYKNSRPEMAPLDTSLSAIAVFASPSAASRFFDVNPLLHNRTKCVAIGPVTAGALLELRTEQVETCARPDLEAVVETVEQLLREESVNGTRSH